MLKFSRKDRYVKPGQPAMSRYASTIANGVFMEVVKKKN
jgi:hypothetical protein